MLNLEMFKIPNGRPKTMGLGLGLIPKQRQHACQLEFGNGGGGLKRQKAWLVAVVVDWKRKKSGDFVVFTFGIESRREYLSIYQLRMKTPVSGLYRNPVKFRM